MGIVQKMKEDVLEILEENKHLTEMMTSREINEKQTCHIATTITALTRLKKDGRVGSERKDGKTYYYLEEILK